MLPCFVAAGFFNAQFTYMKAQRWDQLKDKPLVTGLAYAMRLELQKAYASDSARARSRFVKWCQWVRLEAEALTNGLLEPMRKAADMVERHLEGILGHWKEGLTTAFLEGLNSLFSATKRKARGYRSTEYQIAMLYFVAGQVGDSILWLIPITNVEEPLSTHG